MTSPLRKLPTPDRIRVPNPTPGANFSFTNDKGELILVRSVAFQLVTSAVVATRLVTVTVSVDGLTWWLTSNTLGQAASLTRTWSGWGTQTSSVDSAGGNMFPWRDSGVLLRQGHVLASVITAIDVGDQLSNVVLDVLRFSPEYDQFRPPYVGDYGITDGTA